MIHLGTVHGKPVGIAAGFANRHGLITGGTGGGKSYTVARLVESFAQAGTPCFLADVKGDLAGLAAGSLSVDLIDVFGEKGRPAPLSFRTMGADLTARALDLSPAQSGMVDIMFAASKAHGFKLDTPMDMRQLLLYLEQSRGTYQKEFGKISSASCAVIVRSLLKLDKEAFSSLPFDPLSMFQTGRVTILAAERLMQSPALYAAATLAWLSEIYDRLPECGDRSWTRFAMFLDEAHLLFYDISPAMQSKLERIVRLIRSKGVALFFATQSPDDLPGIIAGQLANRIQHAMRAATPRDMAAVRAAAESMPGHIDPALIGRLRPGEALASLVQGNGSPSTVALVKVARPDSPIGPLTPAQRLAVTGPLERPQEAPPRSYTAVERAVAGTVLAGLVTALGLAWWQLTARGAWLALPLAGLVAMAWRHMPHRRPYHRHRRH